ncbi:MAG: hypothetical protein QOE97_2889 [Pseudonocardiales bacterium]|nr:hypothetical protein [Pseudonocardiales bacterium]
MKTKNGMLIMNRNRNRNRTVAAALVSVALLAGCATSHSARTTPTEPSKAGPPTSAGARVPGGSIMGAAETRGATTGVAAKPSPSALMVCGDETRRDVQQVAHLASLPRAGATFTDHLYACTYALPMGSVVVSVKDLVDAATTTSYYTALRRELGNPPELSGLGEGAYGTGDGRVVLRKDAHVLQVDASRLPPVFGVQSQKRSDFAYEIASDILGCWTNG